MRILNERLNLSVLQAPNHASDMLEIFVKAQKNEGKENVYLWIEAE